MSDAKIKELFNIVQTKKAEIEKAERPNWRTNCLLTLNDKKNNIQVISDVSELVHLASELMMKSSYVLAANHKFGTKVEFSHGGFSLEDWLSDIGTRITKIQITAKKKELVTMESKLNSLLSPEAKAQMELDAIEAMLK